MSLANSAFFAYKQVNVILRSACLLLRKRICFSAVIVSQLLGLVDDDLTEMKCLAGLMLN